MFDLLLHLKVKVLPSLSPNLSKFLFGGWLQVALCLFNTYFDSKQVEWEIQLHRSVYIVYVPVRGINTDNGCPDLVYILNQMCGQIC